MATSFCIFSSFVIIKHHLNYCDFAVEQHNLSLFHDQHNKLLFQLPVQHGSCEEMNNQSIVHSTVELFFKNHKQWMLKEQ
jgi:hypothetical protein